MKDGRPCYQHEPAKETYVGNSTPGRQALTLQLGAKTLFEQHRHMAFVIGEGGRLEWVQRRHEPIRPSDTSPLNTRGWHWRPNGYPFQQKAGA
jgi:hypothetical protein